MRKSLLFLIGTASLFGQQVTWTLSNVTFYGGGVASGFFVVDFGKHLITQMMISTTPGPCPSPYDIGCELSPNGFPGQTHNYTTFSYTGQLEEIRFDDVGFGLLFGAPLTASGGTVNVGGYEEYPHPCPSCSERDFYTGTIIGTPGPPTGCGDERDTIIQEYSQYGVAFTPTCGDFTQNPQPAPDFSFFELQSPDASWAILRGSLLVGLEEIRSLYASPLVINSAYRTPRHNCCEIVPPGKPNSQHVYGDAADIKSDTVSWRTIQQDAKMADACTEPQRMSGWGHVHADWRGGCKPGW